MTTKKSKCFSKAAICTTAVLLCLAIFGTACAKDPSDLSQNNVTESVGVINPDALGSLQDASGTHSLSVSAQAAIVVEAETGRVIWAKNAHTSLPMASTTKIMTALVALENADPAKTVSISSDAVGVEGSSVYLYEDERLSLEDLLYAMLLESANDAAAAIAIEVGGSIEGFSQMMNAKAEELGLERTSFANPHGLDDPEHYTTAAELAKIAVAAMKNESFRNIVSTYKKTIPLNETEGVRLLINHNKMLSRYDGAVGIKTGYTKKSGRCLVSAAEHDHVKLICVTLNAPDDWNDHSTLLDYGFSVCESRSLCEENGFSQAVPVVGGDTDFVTAVNSIPLRITVPSTLPQIFCTVELPHFLYAPIEEGETVGYLTYTVGGQLLARIPLRAGDTVNQITYKKSLWERLSSFGKD